MDPKTLNSETLQPNPAEQTKTVQPEGERGGQQGPEPTRYGDWEKGGRCTDF